jgi:hypothetical protein
MRFAVFLVAIALVGSAIFVVLLELSVAGGGGEPQEQARGGGGEPQEQARGAKAERSDREGTDGKKAKKEGEELEWVAGVVLKAASDKRALVVKPDNGERQLFTYKPEEVEVTLDGKEAGPDAVDEGRRVSIGYEKVTTKKDREVNVAQSIRLESGQGGPGDGSTG